MSLPIHIRWLGLVDYAAAWQLQRDTIAAVTAGAPAQLLLLEHPPTITLGRRASQDNLLLTDEELAAQQIAVHHVDRGGDITYHGPGQLVGYPIINLSQLQGRQQPDLHQYMRDIEQVIINTLAQFGVEGWRYEGYTGVWVNQFSAEATPLSLPQPHKIAAIGLKVSGAGISSHGFALNVSPNLTHFDTIIPCGIQEHGVTSLSRLRQTPTTVEQLLPILKREFSNYFNLLTV